ncbi:MAG: DUF5117 domain-containing protein [Calditrichaeota bacterium]|nr:MAG: DUF5117 domain-containing protein [Calditrichota bacterium]MBL1205045.1 DUF5117 domain-containing protein [Calditrichota bacterium]NOG44875.1 zinc-dependent metalloprotease [Calditrichota bacterium]
MPLSNTFKIFFILVLPSLILSKESISEKTKEMVKYSGFYDFYWDNNSGNIYLEIENLEQEFLLVNSLSQGLGSNDIGLDRGKLNKEYVVYFQRSGPKILLIEPNYYYRAISNDQSERRAVKESFAKSTLWGFEIEAESDNKILINITPFLLSDAQNISRTIKNRQQGSFAINSSRSAINLQRTKSFPRNSEFDALLTFTGKDPGNYIRSVTPTSGSITLFQHFSMIELPDENFQMRANDPRSGFFGISFHDYATPIQEPLLKQFISRHRLQKKFPGQNPSPPVEPIVYYVDNGAPEPIRSALIEGASWWNQAFETAGFKDAFRVEVLPDSADPMDVRYNVIQWVHRSTRGWSYGGGVIDPRTGEIIKGHVSLGSLRVRQDFLIAVGLLAPYKDGTTVPPEMEEMALARLRQLSAHEVGHTLGLMHNFAASSNNRASVMDYPHPLIKINNKASLDLSDAYATGIGSWDKVAISYGYSEFKSKQEETSGLKKIINDYVADGHKFISDSDARPRGGAHPFAHLWENGTNPADELIHILKVREIALNNFSENVIRTGQPYADIENALVPIYLMHRYAVEAASKLISGVDYSYAVRGDNQIITSPVDQKIQEKAFKTILKTLSPDQLILKKSLLNILPPHPPGFSRTRESFGSRTGVTFDPLSGAESAINISLGQLFHHERIARLLQQNPNNKFVDKLYDGFYEAVFEKSFDNPTKQQIQELQQALTIDQLFSLIKNDRSAEYVKSWAFNKLEEWQDEANDFIRFKIKKFLKNPGEFKLSKPGKTPPGSPIGNNNAFDFNCGF